MSQWFAESARVLSVAFRSSIYWIIHGTSRARAVSGTKGDCLPSSLAGSCIVGAGRRSTPRHDLGSALCQEFALLTQLPSQVAAIRNQLSHLELGPSPSRSRSCCSAIVSGISRNTDGV